jgi:hypothetical protein
MISYSVLNKIRNLLVSCKDSLPVLINKIELVQDFLDMSDTNGYYMPRCFKIEELVTKLLLERLGKKECWERFDVRLLWTIDAIQNLNDRKLSVFCGLSLEPLSSFYHFSGKEIDFEDKDKELFDKILISNDSAFQFITAIKHSAGVTHLLFKNSKIEHGIPIVMES